MNYQLETRKCQNPGCENTFRVLPTSKSFTCGKKCLYAKEPPPVEYDNASEETKTEQY